MTKNRITIIDRIYFQDKAGRITSPDEARVARDCESSEQPYGPRHLTATKLRPLDLGWFKDEEGRVSCVGIIHFKNNEGKFQKVPTDEELAKSEAKVLIIDLGGPRLLVRPKETQRFLTDDPTIIKVGPLYEEHPVQYTVTIFPL